MRLGIDSLVFAIIDFFEIIDLFDLFVIIELLTKLIAMLFKIKF